jgi:regulator of protease activity HflC (stomatin/prohibitin superfamily)
MAIPSKRAEHIAIACLVLSVLFFGGALLIGWWSGYFAVSAVSWLILNAVLIWFVLLLQFHQRTLAEQEKLDMAQMAQAERRGTIFQAGDERTTLLAVARRRLKIFEKWFVPIFSALIAIYQLGVGLYLLRKVSQVAEIEGQQPLLCAVFMTAIAFVSFLMSRYATGMSAQLEWKPLRAGGSFLLAVALLSFVLAAALAFAHFQHPTFIAVVGWVIPILLVVLGLETASNAVLDIYRPRLEGQYQRGAFDSRLLGLLSEPGGILRTAATAIDYQFGFKVSQTWFYRLLEKAIMPLVLFAAAVLCLLSCIVVVNPNEQAIVEHFGDPTDGQGHRRVVGPGLAFKWPWPVDIAYKYPTKTVAEISIGYKPKIDPKTGEEVPEPLLWGKKHYEEEYQLLVAAEQSGAESMEEAVPVSLVVATVPVQYRVKDLYAFRYNHVDGEELLKAICYRELTRFAASAQIEVDDEHSLSRSLLGAGREEAKRQLMERIQDKADKAGLGVEIVFLGLQGIHPPPDVAESYQQVVGGVQKQQADILSAEAERKRLLTTLVGSVDEANRLHALVEEYQRAEEQNDRQAITKLGEQLDHAFGQAKGDVFATLSEARAYAFEKAELAKATGERFAGQLKAYNAAPRFYKHQDRLTALEEALEKTRKFIVIADQNDKETVIIDLQDKPLTGVYDVEVPGFRESSEE